MGKGMGMGKGCFASPTLWVVVMIMLSSCTTYGVPSGVPSCLDDPRNMRCMTGEQLERELNAK
jgi:hypothetical protein